MTRLAILASAILIISASAAEAHVGLGGAGLAHGFAHPFTGFDHIAAMIAVGLLAARLGGMALWLVPASISLTRSSVGMTTGRPSVYFAKGAPSR